MANLLDVDFAPEWADTDVAKAAVNAGTRSGTLVRKLSVQEVLDHQAQQEENAGLPDTVQQTLDQQAEAPITTTGTGSEESDRYAAAVFGALSSLRSNTDVYESIAAELEQISSSPTAADDIYERTTQDADQMLVQSFEAAGYAAKDAEQFAAAYKQLIAYRNTVHAPWGFEAHKETTLNGLVALNTAEGNRLRQERIFQDFGMALASKKFDGKNWLGEKGLDMAALFVLPGTTIAMADYTEKFDPGIFGSISNTLGEVVGRIPNLSVTGKGYKAYIESVNKFWEAPVESRLMALPGIHEHLDEIAGGNMFVYMSMMMPFIERGAIEDLQFDYHMDTASILTAVPGSSIYKVVKFASNVAKYRKPINILKQTGNLEKAEAMINRALIDATERARRVTGMTKDELAWSAHPLDVSNIVPGQIDGLAAGAAKQLEDEILAAQDQINEAFRQITDPSTTPLRFYFDEAAKNAKKRQILGDRNDYPNMARIISEDETGFTIEVTKGSKYAGVYDKETLKQANAVLSQNVEDARDSLESIRATIEAQEELTASTKTRKLADLIADKRRAQDALISIRRKMGSDEELLNSEEGSVLLDRIRALDEQIAKAQERAKRKSVDIADYKFADDADAERLRRQMLAWKEQIKRNEKIIKDLEKPPKVETETIKYTFKEDGTFDVDEVSTFTSTSLASPSQVIDQLLAGTTDKATLAEFVEAKILNTLYDVNSRLLRGLTKKELKDIDKILLHGDEQGRVFSISELVQGVDTRFGRVQLRGTKAIAAYAGIRRNFDEIHRIKNFLRVRELERGGYKQLSAKIVNSKGNPVKMFAKEASERKTIPAGVKRIYDHKSGSIVDVTSIEDLGTRLDGEWSVVQFRHGQRVGDEIVNYGLVRWEKDMKPIAGQVLDYAPGYVPRTRPGVFYVVPKRVTRMVDGVKQESHQTERFFASKAEAYEYYAGAKDPDLMEPVPDKRYRSTTHETFEDEWDALNFGGLYTGERTERTILQGIDGKDAQRTSAYKALSNYMAHIANRYSTNELKMNLISRFQQTYGKYLYKNGVDWQAPIITQDLQLKRSIEAARNYIKNIIRMPDPFQDWWSEKMRMIAEAMEPVPGLKGKPREWVMNFASTDPTTFIRTTTFHQYLGMFNPAQWLVQGMGMATAVFAYPTKALKIAPQNLALRAAWLARNNKGALNKIAEASGINAVWLEDVVEEVRKIGLFDSLKTTADYQASVNGISLTGDALRRAMDSGLFFFREGEMATRGYGYLLARDLFMKNKPRNYKMTQKDLDFVAADSMRFIMNLNRSNAAPWQKGLLSIPTQFWQVQAKFLENMLGGSFGYGVRRWSNVEKAKIMAGYLATFGMAGVPFLDSMVNAAIEAKREAANDPTAMTNNRLNIFNGVGMSDEDFARLIKGGLIQLITNWITGSDPEISTRFSIPAGFQETMDLYANGDRTVVDGIMGAAGPGVMRWWDAVRATAQIFGPLNWDEVSPEQFRQASLEFAKVFSSTRNAEKAEWWYQMGRITNSKGQTLIGLSDIDQDEMTSILMWQALGFGPSKIGWMYDLEGGVIKRMKRGSRRDPLGGDLEEDGGALSERVTSRVDAMLTIWNRFAPEENALDTDNKRRALNRYFAVAMVGLTEEERKQFYDSFKKKMLDNATGESRISKAIDKAIVAIAESGGKTPTGAMFNPLMP